MPAKKKSEQAEEQKVDIATYEANIKSTTNRDAYQVMEAGHRAKWEAEKVFEMDPNEDKEKVREALPSVVALGRPYPI